MTHEERMEMLINTVSELVNFHSELEWMMIKNFDKLFYQKLRVDVMYVASGITGLMVLLDKLHADGGDVRISR